MAMEWVILISMATLGITIVQSIYQANEILAKRLDELHKKVDDLIKKLRRLKRNEASTCSASPRQHGSRTVRQRRPQNVHSLQDGDSTPGSRVEEGEVKALGKYS
ncbi:MAG: hypothetical protein ABSC48_16745 [Terracidiphilus sp.]|jgi:hypothetical protein